MALSGNTVPPSPGAPASPNGNFNFVHGDPRDVRVRQAVSVAYSLAGGQAAALVVRKWEGAK
jgi:hypothetical protein